MAGALAKLHAQGLLGDVTELRAQRELRYSELRVAGGAVAGAARQGSNSCSDLAAAHSRRENVLLWERTSSSWHRAAKATGELQLVLKDSGVGLFMVDCLLEALQALHLQLALHGKFGPDRKEQADAFVDECTLRTRMLQLQLASSVQVAWKRVHAAHARVGVDRRQQLVASGCERPRTTPTAPRTPHMRLLLLAALALSGSSTSDVTRTAAVNIALACSKLPPTSALAALVVALAAAAPLGGGAAAATAAAAAVPSNAEQLAKCTCALRQLTVEELQKMRRKKGRSLTSAQIQWLAAAGDAGTLAFDGIRSSDLLTQLRPVVAAFATATAGALRYSQGRSGGWSPSLPSHHCCSSQACSSA